MRRRFFWGMVAVAVTTLLVGGLAAAALISRSVETSARAEFARQAQATARLLEADLPAGGIPADDGRARIAQILRDVAMVGGHEFVEAGIVGPRGAVTVLGTPGPLLEQVPGITDLAGIVAFDAEVEGRTVTAVARPIRIGERGSLVVVIGTTIELFPWREVGGRFLFALALAVLLAALLAGSFSRFAVKRLAGLRSAARRVAGGDLTARVPTGSGDEVDEVGDAFNDMTSQLEEARRREREFLVAVGHDLRTPLTTVRGYAEAMAEGRVDRDDLARVGAVLGTETDRLRRLIEDLMLLSRIEAAEFGLRPEPLDLSAHLRGVLHGFEERAAAAGVRLVDAIEPVGEVTLDPDRIGQVVANLLENALRYTPEAGTVTMVVRRDATALEIAVADTGPGIDSADLPHVFERLYVATRYRPVRPEGSGLGLSIVANLVAAMGGTARAESSLGQGTTIRVLLPGTGTGRL